MPETAPKPFIKADQGKPQFDLIDPWFLEEVAAVLEYGCRKYEPNNWRRGANWGRYFGAAMRHLWAFWGGEGYDEETGLHHMAHATCCIMFLFAYDKQELGTDDRPEGDKA